MKKELEKFLQRYEEEIMEAAEAMRAEPMPETTEELFAVYERNGNRLLYETVYFRRRRFLAVYGMAVFLRKRQEDIQKLCEAVRGICREFCWALPAHVDRMKNPDGWTLTVDLFAAETGFALAEIRDLCAEELPQEVKELIRKAVMERVILPFEESPVPYGAWENGSNNWNAVCSGSVGCAAIYLLQKEPERLSRLLERLQNSLVHYIDGFADDGACTEGVGYFTYGMSFYAAFADMLENYTGGRIDLMAGEKLCRIMEFQQKCYFCGGLSVSFSDGSSRESFRVGLTCFLAQKDEQVEFPNMELAAGLDTDNCYRWAELYRDYAFTRRYLEKTESGRAVSGGSGQITLPDAQWTVCQGAMESAMAAKGGHNGEPHNHNDVGSFCYVIGREIFLADLGAGEYTRDYFLDEKRYTIFVNQSLSHNLPIINGHGQLPGREYGSSGFSTDGKGHTEIAFENAYGETRLRRCLRTLDFHIGTGNLCIKDHFETEAGEKPFSIVESLVTPLMPRVEGNRVLLKGEKHCCAIVTDSHTEIRAAAHTYNDHQGNPTTVYLLQWAAPMAEGKEETDCSFRIEPMNE